MGLNPAVHLHTHIDCYCISVGCILFFEKNYLLFAQWPESCDLRQKWWLWLPTAFLSTRCLQLIPAVMQAWIVSDEQKDPHLAIDSTNKTPCNTFWVNWKKLLIHQLWRFRDSLDFVFQLLPRISLYTCLCVHLLFMQCIRSATCHSLKSLCYYHHLARISPTSSLPIAAKRTLGTSTLNVHFCFMSPFFPWLQLPRDHLQRCSIPLPFSATNALGKAGRRVAECIRMWHFCQPTACGWPKHRQQKKKAHRNPEKNNQSNEEAVPAQGMCEMGKTRRLSECKEKCLLSPSKAEVAF